MPYLGRGGAERTSFKWTNSYATSCSLDGTARTIHRPPDLGSSLISAQTSSQPANIYIHHSQIQRRAIIIISVVSYVSIRPKYNTTWNQLSIIYRCTWELSTGCPVKLSALRFCYFLGFQSTYRRTSGHFSIAQETRISKLTLLSFLREKLI